MVGIVESWNARAGKVKRVGDKVGMNKCGAEVNNEMRGLVKIGNVGRGCKNF